VVLCGDRQRIPLLERFNGIYLRDSSVVSLPKELHALWPGVGGTQGESTAVKLQVRLEYSSGQLAGPVLHAGRVHDTASPYQNESLPRGALRLGLTAAAAVPLIELVVRMLKIKSIDR